MSSDLDTPGTGSLFQAVQRGSTLTNHVADRIQDSIVENHLRPGDRLPSERQLASQFGVSRTVVREAVRMLAARNLLKVSPGSGTIVSNPTAESVVQSMNLFLRVGQSHLDYTKVLEVRRILEVEIAGLAAERHTAADLQKIEDILRHTSERKEDRSRFAESDVAFHSALARATHNELFSLLFDVVADSMIIVCRIAFDVPDSPSIALEHHRAIFSHVEGTDPEGARKAMREHIDDSERIIRQTAASGVDQAAKGDTWDERGGVQP